MVTKKQITNDWKQLFPELKKTMWSFLCTFRIVLREKSEKSQ